MKIVISYLFALFVSSFALAQSPQSADPQDNDITNIIRDILGDVDGAFPPPPSAMGSVVDVMAINIQLGENTPTNDPAQPLGDWLVVSAYAPPNSSNSRSKGELLSETKLRLKDLNPPFEIYLTTPQSAAGESRETHLYGYIEDRNGRIVMTSGESPTRAQTVGATLSFRPTAISTSPVMTTPTISGFEQAKGKVDLSDRNSLFRGAVLTVQLSETGLAGGQGNKIIGDVRVDIDQRSAPFDFTLDYGVPNGGFKTPLVLTAFITDWANRKTHVMAKALDYNGPNYDYRLKLDSFKQGAEVADFRFTTPENAARTEIKGQALFNAYRGLPLGSYLKIRLRSPLGPNQQPQDLSTTAIALNNKRGAVDFTAVAPSTYFDPELPALLLDLAVINPSGNVLFESEATPVNPSATNLITLSPRPIY
jgi:hypothetical protein